MGSGGWGIPGGIPALSNKFFSYFAMFIFFLILRGATFFMLRREGQHTKSLPEAEKYVATLLELLGYIWHHNFYKTV